MIVYDITDLSSFLSVPMWMSEIKKFASSDANILLVGNKTDLAKQRQVSYEQGLEMAAKHGISFIETSAKSPSNVQECFKMLTDEILNRITGSILRKNSNEIEPEDVPLKRIKNGKSIISEKKSDKKAGGCCS